MLAHAYFLFALTICHKPATHFLFARSSNSATTGSSVTDSRPWMTPTDPVPQRVAKLLAEVCEADAVIEEPHPVELSKEQRTHNCYYPLLVSFYSLYLM